MRSRAQRLRAAPHFLAQLISQSQVKSAAAMPAHRWIFQPISLKRRWPILPFQTASCSDAWFHNVRLCDDASELDQFSANAYRIRRQCARCSRRGLITKDGRERPGSGLPSICCMPMVISPQPGTPNDQFRRCRAVAPGDSWCRSRRRNREIRDDEHDRTRAKRSDQEAATNGRRAG
jgi:hypothetical protein